jgi:hypothetical protein
VVHHARASATATPEDLTPRTVGPKRLLERFEIPEKCAIRVVHEFQFATDESGLGDEMAIVTRFVKV